MHDYVKEVKEVLAGADCIHASHVVQAAIREVAEQLNRDLRGASTEGLAPVVLCVMNGGLVFTGELLRQLEFPLMQDYVHVSRYGDKTTGGELYYLRSVPDWVEGRTVLVVDDILDKGETLRAIVDECAHKRAGKVLSVVLVSKDVERAEGGVDNADYTALTVPDRYVFGYGMDYKGHLRNANGIFAANLD